MKRSALRTPFVTLALAAACALAPAAATADDSGVTLRITPRIPSDDRLTWNADYLITNPGETGFFPDSIFLDFEDRDGATPRRWSEPFNALLSTLAPVSGRDSLPSSLFVPARFERGTLTLRLYGHNNAGIVGPLTATAELVPGPVNEAYPSKLVKVGKQTVEIVNMPAREGTGPAPGVLVVHPDGEHARRQLALGLVLHEKGYAVTLVSLPGSGGSSGPADLSGPATTAAMDAALNELLHENGVDPAHVAVIGTGHGATAAALLAARNPKVTALSLAGAEYDLWQAYRASDAAGQAAITAAAGKDSAAWRARSPLKQKAPRCAVLILHGEQDARSTPASAQAFAAAVTAAGGKADVKLAKGRAHELSPLTVRSSTLSFLKAQFGK